MTHIAKSRLPQTRKTRMRRQPPWSKAMRWIAALLLLPSLASAGVIYHEAPAVDPPAVKKPVARRGYPVRGSLWSHPGEIHAHLMSGEHRGKFDPDWIRSLTSAEAEAVHSDDHEGRLRMQYVVRPMRKTSAAAPVQAACPS